MSKICKECGKVIQVDDQFQEEKDYILCEDCALTAFYKTKLKIYKGEYQK